MVDQVTRPTKRQTRKKYVASLLHCPINQNCEIPPKSHFGSASLLRTGDLCKKLETTPSLMSIPTSGKPRRLSVMAEFLASQSALVSSSTDARVYWQF